MKLINFIIKTVIIIGSTLILSCNSTPSNQETSLKINEQEWMMKNLNVSHFRNGDPIPELKTSEEWENATNKMLPGWCYYKNDPAKGVESGKLYNWYAINDTRGLAPEGCHIPSREEWNQVEKELAGNERLFSENLGGFRHMFGNFRMYAQVGYWASATETDAEVTTWIRQFSANTLSESNSGKGTGFSVRCIKDNLKEITP